MFLLLDASCSFGDQCAFPVRHLLFRFSDLLHPILDLFPIRVYPRKSAVSFFVFSDAGDHPIPSASSVPLCFKGFGFPDLLRVSAPLR
jgi:hypothetical protein